jgi:hypothetical protein
MWPFDHPNNLKLLGCALSSTLRIDRRAVVDPLDIFDDLLVRLLRVPVVFLMSHSSVVTMSQKLTANAASQQALLINWKP